MPQLIIFLCCLFLSSAEGVQLPYRSDPVIVPPAIEINSRVSKKKPLKLPLVAPKAFIMLDPGHGGSDTGTQSISKPRYQEKSLNLVTAKFLRHYLTQMGYKVELTRETDHFVTLEKRSQMANEKEPAIFVSIHYNSAPSLDAKGVEVFYYQDKGQKDRMLASKKLAQNVLKSVLVYTKAESRGIKQGNFAVIRETKMPAILVEGGFVSNEEELQKLKDPTYLKKVAWGIAKGIDHYFKQ